MTTTPLAPKLTSPFPVSATPNRPDSLGRFGIFGGKYVPETLMSALTELETAFYHYKNDPDFNRELDG